MQPIDRALERPLRAAHWLCGLFVLSACQTAPPVEDVDPSSWARPEEVRVEHLELDLTVDFEAKVLRGRASLALDRAPGADELWLDSWDLDIEKITLGDGGEAKWEYGESVPFLGQALRVELGPDTEVVHIDYASRPGAGALLWLEPEQTHGGRHPFLFSQSQTVLARSWIPIQDSPGIRFSYEATIRVPSELLALMSAVNPTERNEEGVYRFVMSEPVPAYLVALAVGELEFGELGPRSGVYAEPGMLEASVYEFGQTPAMMTAVEALYGDYRWGRYDILVLPPYFPYGGMENPRLTFVTPTVIAGDRSLVSLIAHELAHSWSGNLITNRSWEDFWLNEGFTVYLERRVMEEIEGPDYAGMLEQLGYGDWLDELEEYGADSPLTALKVQLDGIDPEEGLTNVAYEKGYFFLRRLEDTIGRDRLDAFLKSYFDAHAFESMDTEGFLQILRDELGSDAESVFETVGVHEWIYEPGMPENTPHPRDVAFQSVREALGRIGDNGPEAEFDSDGWTSHHWQEFLRGLPSGWTAEELARLDARFSFSETGNSEILHEWLLHSIDAWYEPAFPALENFLLGMGRRKFLRPLYERLATTERGTELAREIYAQARPRYHPIATRTIDGILEIES